MLVQSCAIILHIFHHNINESQLVNSVQYCAFIRNIKSINFFYDTETKI